MSKIDFLPYPIWTWTELIKISRACLIWILLYITPLSSIYHTECKLKVWKKWVSYTFKNNQNSSYEHGTRKASWKVIFCLPKLLMQYWLSLQPLCTHSWNVFIPPSVISQLQNGGFSRPMHSWTSLIVLACGTHPYISARPSNYTLYTRIVEDKYRSKNV